MLFHCLAGHPPFQGDSVGTVLLQHMTSPVPELRSIGVAVPRALDELVQRLLRKDPSDRYQTAEAVLFDLKSIAESLAAGAREPACVVGLHDRRLSLTEPAFIGREQELEQLDEQIRQVVNGNTMLVSVEAESGGGKTRLLDEVALQGIRAGMRVFCGKCFEHVGQKPFRVFEGIIEDLFTTCQTHPALAKTIRRRLGEHVDAVGAALPELTEALGWKTSTALGPEAFGEVRSIQALSAFLDALGAEQPALIILDDCQWADELTLKLLAHWSRIQHDTTHGKSRVLLLTAFRSEEVPADHLLREMQPALQLQLATLGADEVRRLLESMAGALPDEAIDVVCQLSDGSPFMASAVLRGMVESGALLAKPEGWRIESLALADLQSSSRSAGFLSRRIELLPPSDLKLLTIGSVIGKEYDLDLASRLAGLSMPNAMAALEKARQRHIVWISPDNTEVTFVHDKIREALLDRLTSERRCALHHDVAEYLQEKDSSRIYELAYHFDAAGDYELALPYALQAAELARSQHALEIAEKQYHIAQRATGAVR